MQSLVCIAPTHNLYWGEKRAALSDYSLFLQDFRCNLCAIRKNLRNKNQRDRYISLARRIDSAPAILAESSALRQFFDDIAHFRSYLVTGARSLALTTTSGLFAPRASLSTPHTAVCTLCHSFQCVKSCSHILDLVSERSELSKS